MDLPALCSAFESFSKLDEANRSAVLCLLREETLPADLDASAANIADIRDFVSALGALKLIPPADVRDYLTSLEGAIAAMDDDDEDEDEDNDEDDGTDFVLDEDEKFK